MNVIAKYEDLPIGVIGDIHSDFGVIRDKINYYNLEGALLFVCGDFGVGFRYNDPREPRKEKKRLQELNAFLKKRNVFLYVTRGNHDNPIFFDGKHNFTNLIFMQDYDVVEIGEHRVLGIGGATCVDRKPNHHFKNYRGKNYIGRREGIDWWPGAEKVVYDEEQLETLVGIDVAIMHTCPDFVYPPALGGAVWKWIDCDYELKEELIAERELVTKIYNKLSELNIVKLFFYGHFHETHIQKHDLTTFCLLDINEFREVRFKNDEDDLE